MDRYVAGDWLVECNEGTKNTTADLTVYDNSFISFQNRKSGISYEFHTYEALELTNKLTQEELFYRSGEIQGNSVSYYNPNDESFCTSYKGRVKPIHLHGEIKIQPSTEVIPFERLGSNFPIL